MDWERLFRDLSPGVEQPTQNWYGQGESDCLIKTKHCDGPCGCYDPLKVAKSLDI
ncbi:hypothetical protein YC2023_066064 [Brassica napus]